MTRKLYGVVYELVLTPPHQDPDPAVSEYVGKARDMTRRMAKTGSGHRSPTSIAEDPWKAHILPGRAGYRILERIYWDGDETDSHAAALAEDRLRRAEAAQIEMRHAKRNDVKPIRPRGHQSAPKRAPRPAPPRRLTASQLRARSRARRRAFLFAALWLTPAVLIGRAFATSDVQWDHPATPWVATPLIATLVAWPAFWWLLRTTRRFTRGTR